MKEYYLYTAYGRRKMKTRDKINNKFKPIIIAFLAAILYGINSPLSKLLVEEVPPTFLAALLYLGAGLGMLFIHGLVTLKKKDHAEARVSKRELPYIISMVVLDIAAPILLMFGLSLTFAANAALLNNFEIVATSIIALIIFKEAVGYRMWIAILLITISSILISVDGAGIMSFSIGSLFVLLACILWGFENNCTRMLSLKDPIQIVIIKGFGSGIGALLIAIAREEVRVNLIYVILALVLGFIAYGLSIYCYIIAQRTLGAAKTSTFYAAAPFIGVFLSWAIFREGMTTVFLIAFLLMLAGSYLAITEKHNHLHKHLEMTHEHKHNHIDGHHNHIHSPEVVGEHNHVHTHENLVHTHSHSSDLHHMHTH
jgi:drug/metabolite transporter (DMT)-like permease